MAEKSGIAVGLNKGRVVATRKLAARPAQRKGKLGKRVKNIRELIRDVVGSAPYEKRLMELLKVGRDKRALKLAKRKVRERQAGICAAGLGFVGESLRRAPPIAHLFRLKCAPLWGFMRGKHDKGAVCAARGCPLQCRMVSGESPRGPWQSRRVPRVTPGGGLFWAK
eukprot:CAMPEP_0181352540 /NCGR_PEP_ID=MMETSP1106-20121128/2363_1 /TAXON_ID=81844 /ORGANISM="Mantoniella antarctica, Strain SL-175" /LENGTH=166 /DNA_ID=CAMNT_0023465105 /DNA_START=45 /DNA_END=542 /DNA_ORIENTATION=-